MHFFILAGNVERGEYMRINELSDLSPFARRQASFRVGCRWGRLAFEGETGFEWSVPKVVNHIYFALRRELLAGRNRCWYAWVVGFVLGNLAVLAETENVLAEVGFAH